MSTLVLRLAGPMQAWGLEDKFNRRGTARGPTKSGVIGLLAAAMGCRREASLGDFADLRFGMLAVRPGQLLRDYHTVSRDGQKTDFVTERFYLADAIFLVGLEGEEAFLQELHEAVESPVFPLYLGRRSCPPVGRVSLGVRRETLQTALEQAFYAESPSAREPYYTLTCDAQEPCATRQRDMPISFAPAHRKHGYRYTENRVVQTGKQQADTEHDAFAELGGDEDISLTN